MSLLVLLQPEAIRVTDLVFSQTPLTNPIRLVFGDDGSSVDATIDLNVNAALPALAFDVLLTRATPISVSATLPALSCAVQATYLSLTSRGVVSATLGAWDVADTAQAQTAQYWQQSGRVSVGAASRHQFATARQIDAVAFHQVAIRLAVQAALAHQQSARLQANATGFRHQNGVPQTNGKTAKFQDAVPLGRTAKSKYQDGLRNVRPAQTHVWQNAVPVSRELDQSFQKALSMYRYWGGRHQNARPPGPGMYQKPVVPPVDLRCYIPPLGGAVDLLLSTAWSADTGLVYICETHVVPPIPSTVVVPIRRVYIVINSSSLRRVDGNINLPTFGMSMSLDMESWTWGFTATLPGTELTNLEPDSAGEPVEVEVTINGVGYRALVESISRSREFGKSTISVQGRGKNALLDAPYSPLLNFANASTRTANQLVEDVLSVNGVSMGLDVIWGLEDWSVPAGVFSHQGSYISAVNAIANAAGGYVQPLPAAQGVRVLPRYPSAPWEWGTVTPDYELPAAVTTREGIEWSERARYNRVYVSGQQQGVLGQVTRDGTAGDLLAPMVTDPLITNAIAARQRGLSILSNTGRIAMVSLRLPVLAQTGVITPGKFVRYVDGGTTRLGLVRSVGLDIGTPEIWQTIGVETHVS